MKKLIGTMMMLALLGAGCMGAFGAEQETEAAEGLKYIEYTAGGIGGAYFTVTPGEMTLHLIGSGGTEKDTITVLKKNR